jgi:uncharacterized protein (DUF3084 family)
MEQRSQPASRILPHRRQHVGVDSEGHLDPLVPETLLHDMRRHAGFQQERGAGVPQPVHRDGADTGREDSLGLPLQANNLGQREFARVTKAAEVNDDCRTLTAFSHGDTAPRTAVGATIVATARTDSPRMSVGNERRVRLQVRIGFLRFFEESARPCGAPSNEETLRTAWN